MFDQAPYRNLLKQINDIASEQGKKKLNETQEGILLGLCKNAKPSRIAQQIGKERSYIQYELNVNLYPFIYILLEKEKIYQKQGDKTSYKNIHQGLNQYLEKYSSSIFMNGNIPSVTAKTIIDKAQKELLNPVKIGLLPSDLAELNKQIDNADLLYNQQKYERTLKIYELLIERIFSFYSLENSNENICFFGVLVKAVSCFNAIKAYEDVVELGLFSLKYIMDLKGRADLYGYLAGAYHEEYLFTNNCQPFKIAAHFYSQAQLLTPDDSVLLWNIFDLLFEEQKRKNPKLDNSKSILLAWKNFLKIQKNPKSNYKRYRDKILRDRDRMLEENPNNQWLQHNLKQI